MMMSTTFVVVVLKLATQKINIRMASCVHCPSLTNNALSVTRCLSFTSCEQKMMTMSVTLVVTVLELVK
jgi:hypothetical protein